MSNNEETTPQLFTSILKTKNPFKIKGRSFKYLQTFKKDEEEGTTLVCKCQNVDDGREYVIKIIKLDKLKNDIVMVNNTITKTDISHTCTGRHGLGDWKFSDTIDKLFTSLLVIYEVAEVIDDELILVSEYRGINLETYGKNKGTLHLCEVLQVFIGLVNALFLIHREEIIHRDIKPLNVFINYETQKTKIGDIDMIQVALGDFGIAMKNPTETYVESSNSAENNQETNPINYETTYSKNYGSPGYTAPEAENGKFCKECDVWSLARTMIWFLFIRKDINNSLDINQLNEFEKEITTADLSDNVVISRFIKSGGLDDDIESWREFITILRKMLERNPGERILPSEIISYIIVREPLDRPINLEWFLFELHDCFRNNEQIMYLCSRQNTEPSFVLNDESQKFITKDREIVLEAVKQNGEAFKFVDESLKKDREIVLNAVKRCRWAFEWVDESLKKDREFVLEAVKQNGEVFKFVDESFKKDREFVLKAVKQRYFVLEYADESLKKDREIILKAVKTCGLSLKYADESFKKDREIVLEAVKQNGEAFKFVDESLKKDREIVLNAVKRCRWAFEWVDESLKKDREFVLEVVKTYGLSLKYADESLKKDREIVLKAVKRCGWVFEYADKSLKKDREIVLEAIKQDGEAFKFVDKSLKKDREIVLKAVKQSGWAFEWVDESLKKDREFVLEVVKQSCFVFEYADESFRKDREFVLEVVKTYGLSLKYADESLKKDREIVLEAVKQSGWAFEYADESLKKDREFVLEAVKRNSIALEYISSFHHLRKIEN